MLSHCLILALILFITGAAITITNKNLVKTVIGVCFMLNAAAINFIAANAFLTAENSLLNKTASANSALASAFAPLEGITQSFNLPQGQADAVLIMLLGLIQVLIGFTLIFLTYLKYQKANTEALCIVKSDESRKEGEETWI